MEAVSLFLVPGIGFLCTIVFGVWLSLAGKPYNGILFNIHKLVALTAVIWTGIQLSKTFKELPVESLFILLAVLAAVCVIALFASGAMMSTGQLKYALMLAIHRITTGVMVATLLLFVYLMPGPL